MAWGVFTWVRIWAGVAADLGVIYVYFGSRNGATSSPARSAARFRCWSLVAG